MIFRAACAALLALATSPAQSPPPDSATEAALLRHIAVLADDAMGGRKPGTSGAGRAVRYIAREMEAAGLRPGAADGGWYQTVDLVERRPVSARMEWRAGGRKEQVESDALVLLGRDRRQRLDRAPLIFAGHGIPRNMDGVNVAGAVVLLLPGQPKDMTNAPPLDLRRAALVRGGAAAVLTLLPGDAGWKAVRAQYAGGRTTLAVDEAPSIAGALSHSAWTSLLRELGADPRQLETAASDPAFRAVTFGATADLRVKTRIRGYRSVNVIGRLPGGRSDEAVLTMAHWDHLGVCRAPGVSDRICNGAVDNASGVAAMIEIARGLAHGPKPPRGLIFIATTAEEYGLLGARALVRNPPAPLKRIVAALNLDTVAIAPRGASVATVGRGMTRLDPFVEAAAKALGRKVDPGTAGNAYVTRQDGFVLMNAGVPSVMVGGSFNDPALLERYFASRYHAPSDDLSHGLELGGAAEDVALHIALIGLLADPARFPALAR